MWAAGVCLYVWVWGCLPFQGDSIPDMFTAIKQKPLTFPAHPDCHPHLKDLITKASHSPNCMHPACPLAHAVQRVASDWPAPCACDSSIGFVLPICADYYSVILTVIDHAGTSAECYTAMKGCFVSLAVVTEADEARQRSALHFICIIPLLSSFLTHTVCSGTLRATELHSCFVSGEMTPLSDSQPPRMLASH